MQKIENLEFVHIVNFEFSTSMKNNGIIFLLFFDDPFAEICKSKEFLDITTAGKHRPFSAKPIKHNSFKQNQVGRDVELKNSHIFLFKSPRDVHQIGTLSVQLDLDQRSLVGIVMQRPMLLVIC